MYLIFMLDTINLSKGGISDINNLKPICARCNLSTFNKYTIQEWIQLSKPKKMFFLLLTTFETFLYLYRG